MNLEVKVKLRLKFVPIISDINNNNGAITLQK